MGRLTFMEPVDRYSKIDKNSKLGMYNKLDNDPSKDLIEISSDYEKRTDPITKKENVQHGGIDYAVGVSTPVVASERGGGCKSRL